MAKYSFDFQEKNNSAFKTEIMKVAIVLLTCIFMNPSLLCAYDFIDKGYAFEILSEAEKLCSLVAFEENPQNIDCYESPYTGDIVIPGYATYNNNTYRVYQIGEYAFYNSKGLTSLMVPSTLKAIKNNAFENCCGVPFVDDGGNSNFIPLTRIHIEDSPEPISLGFSSESGHCLFGRLSATELYLGRNVEFYSDFNKGYYGPFEIAIEKVCLGDYVTEIPNGLKIGSNHSITELQLSPNLNKIGRHAFNQTLSIRALTIPEGVVEIGSNAFYGNNSLTEVCLPSTLSIIETYGFSSCSNISVVYCYASNPPSAAGAAYSYHVANARLRVPSESIEKYKGSTFWNNFGEILPLDSSSNTSPAPCKVNIHFPEGGAVRHYVNSGQSFSFSIHPTEGWNIYSVMCNGAELKDSMSGDGLINLSSISSDLDVNIIFSKDGESGVNTICAGVPFSISTHGKTITITGDYNSAYLFNVDGQCEMSLCPNEFRVATAGIYILNIDGHIFKFLVTE